MNIYRSMAETGRLVGFGGGGASSANAWQDKLFFETSPSPGGEGEGGELGGREGGRSMCDAVSSRGFQGLDGSLGSPGMVLHVCVYTCMCVNV